MYPKGHTLSYYCMYCLNSICSLIPEAVQTRPCALKPTGVMLFIGQLVLPAGHSLGATMIIKNRTMLFSLYITEGIWVGR